MMRKGVQREHDPQGLTEPWRARLDRGAPTRRYTPPQSQLIG